MTRNLNGSRLATVIVDGRDSAVVCDHRIDPVSCFAPFESRHRVVVMLKVDRPCYYLNPVGRWRVECVGVSVLKPLHVASESRRWRDRWYVQLVAGFALDVLDEVLSRGARSEEQLPPASALRRLTAVIFANVCIHARCLEIFQACLGVPLAEYVIVPTSAQACSDRND